MKLHGQRWLYRVGNAEVCVDNAFSWLGWTQERWVINGEVARATGGWWVSRRSFEEPWLTPLGDGVLTAELRAKTDYVACRLLLDGVVCEHDALFEASWYGRGGWPDADAWTEVRRFAVFDGLSLGLRRRGQRA